MKIAALFHPDYREQLEDWTKWRTVYEGGRLFRDRYLEKFTSKEDDDEFTVRRKLSPPTSFAKKAVNEIKDGIYQKLSEIRRSGGTKTYNDAVNGGLFGVDLLGSSMTEFMGRDIIRELLVMHKVGIYVDMPKLNSNLLSENATKRPYIYYYSAENILNWTIDEEVNPNHYSSILISEDVFVKDKQTGFSTQSITIYKHFWKEDNQIYVQFYDQEMGIRDPLNSYEPDPLAQPLALNITRIPFHILNISASLLTDAADFQISLLNIYSSDINYILKANFPFYVEQYDSRAESPHLKNDGEQPQAKVGITSGRRYPEGMQQPAFIHPSSEPLTASMNKQEQMKRDIRELVGASVASLDPKQPVNGSGVEAGMSIIGLELQYAERQIGEIWAMYENSKEFPTVFYPDKYDLKSEKDNQEEAISLSQLMPVISSQTYQKCIAKEITQKLLASKVSIKELDTINKEIESSTVAYVEPSVLSQDIQNGLVDLETASQIRGYPKGSVDKAKKDHEERLARIAEAQGGNGTGNADILSNPANNRKNEKAKSRDTTQDPVVTDKTRGEGK